MPDMPRARSRLCSKRTDYTIKAQPDYGVCHRWCRCVEEITIITATCNDILRLRQPPQLLAFVLSYSYPKTVHSSSSCPHDSPQSTHSPRQETSSSFKALAERNLRGVDDWTRLSAIMWQHAWMAKRTQSHTLSLSERTDIAVNTQPDQKGMQELAHS